MGKEIFGQMNNYSGLQKKLHQLALSRQFMRETAFDFESAIISTEQDSENHVFVAGLARSGTTILLNALYESSQFSSLSYDDMPFVLAPNLWSYLRLGKQINDTVERAHNDGIQVSFSSPEAFEEVFWMTFDQNDINTKEKFKSYVRLINMKYKKTRYLSKNNQNIRRVEQISDIFPRSQILIPFRDPLQHSFSLLCQHQKFLEYSKNDVFISNYMKWIGHTEFGPQYKAIHEKNLIFKNTLDINHWLEQWILTYRNCYAQLKHKNNVHFICYEKLCSSEVYWKSILKLLDLGHEYSFQFKKSQKEFYLKIDDGLIEGASYLYSELTNCSLSNETRA